MTFISFDSWIKTIRLLYISIHKKSLTNQFKPALTENLQCKSIIIIRLLSTNYVVFSVELIQ